ncbi:MAG: DUF3365 domain-containing protein [Magnetovibrio sp.]|nr:DUF3365 domain-containing protein [Magnetovibrio sp.]
MDFRPVSRLTGIYGVAILVAVVWTSLVSGSLVWNMHSEKLQTLALATKEARSHFNKDNSLRLWAASHGGVYVPASERTPPNPMLSHIPERDITTPSGKKLTLMNPAYVMRQMMNDFSKKYGVKGKITTFPDKLFNPNNAPDDWELQALVNFEGGLTEALELTNIDGRGFMRLMRPLHIEKSCLKCHAHQGYKVGELRGGVSVSVPMADYYVQARKYNQITSASHALIWLLGFVGIVVVARKSRAATLDLLETKEVAIAASNAKTDFLANMSHELRTPLNAIIGFSQMVGSEVYGSVGGDKNKEYLRDIQLSGEHLLNVINDILDVARIETGELDYVDGRVNIRDIIVTCVRLETAQALQTGLTIGADLPDDLPCVIADVTRIKQILLNLVSNSIKFTPPGGSIQIEAHVNAEGDLLVSVMDSGIGMKGSDIPKVLEPFVQVENIMTRSHRGSGLGLSMSRRLSELHEGTLEIKSERGVGTTVTIMFPKKRIV